MKDSPTQIERVYNIFEAYLADDGELLSGLNARLDREELSVFSLEVELDQRKADFYEYTASGEDEEYYENRIIKCQEELDEAIATRDSVIKIIEDYHAYFYPAMRTFISAFRKEKSSPVEALANYRTAFQQYDKTIKSPSLVSLFEAFEKLGAHEMYLSVFIARGKLFIAQHAELSFTRKRKLLQQAEQQYSKALTHAPDTTGGNALKLELIAELEMIRKLQGELKRTPVTVSGEAGAIRGQRRKEVLSSADTQTELEAIQKLYDVESINEAYARVEELFNKQLPKALLGRAFTLRAHCHLSKSLATDTEIQKTLFLNQAWRYLNNVLSHDASNDEAAILFQIVKKQREDQGLPAEPPSAGRGGLFSSRGRGRRDRRPTRRKGRGRGRGTSRGGRRHVRGGAGGP